MSTVAESNYDEVLLRVTLRGAIARASDEHLESSEDTEHTPRWFGKELALTSLKKSQIRNVENLTYTTDKVSDILDLLKKLVGRDTKAKGWAKGEIGQQLIRTLEDLRATTANGIAEQLRGKYEAAKADTDLARGIHLELCREYVKHMVAHFLYLRRDQED